MCRRLVLQFLNPLCEFVNKVIEFIDLLTEFLNRCVVLFLCPVRILNLGVGRLFVFLNICFLGCRPLCRLLFNNLFRFLLDFLDLGILYDNGSAVLKNVVPVLYRLSVPVLIHKVHFCSDLDFTVNVPSDDPLVACGGRKLHLSYHRFQRFLDAFDFHKTVILFFFFIVILILIILWFNIEHTCQREALVSPFLHLLPYTVIGDVELGEKRTVLVVLITLGADPLFGVLDEELVHKYPVLQLERVLGVHIVLQTHLQIFFSHQRYGLLGIGDVVLEAVLVPSVNRHIGGHNKPENLSLLIALDIIGHKSLILVESHKVGHCGRTVNQGYDEHPRCCVVRIYFSPV